MNKPNLFIPGFPKSGTSSLHSMLTEHPEISDGGFKEPHTYSWDIKYKKRNQFFRERYSNINSKYLLDSSTTYMVSKCAIERIIKDTPKAKFIIIARDPIDRIVSHFNWISSLGYVDSTFKTEFEHELFKPFDYRNHFGGNYKSYLDFSKYGEQVNNIKSLVPQDQIKFLLFEKTFEEWDKVKWELGDFLDINLKEINIIQKNITTTKHKLKKIKTRKKSLAHRIRHRLRYELRILYGYPRSKKIMNPIFDKIKRTDVEDLLLPYLIEEVKILKELGYDVSYWPTVKFIESNK